jgi:hypothetical protein
MAVPMVGGLSRLCRHCLHNLAVGEEEGSRSVMTAIGPLPQKIPLIVPFPLIPTVALIPNAFAMV